MRRIKTLAIICSGLILIASCSSDRSQNVQIKKAADIHLKSIAKHDSIMEILVSQKNMVEKRLATETIESNIKSYKAMLKSLDKSMRLLNDWDEDLIGVPGLEHDHDHPHDQQHDHSHHHNDDILEDLSDKEILEIQIAYNEHLDKIEEKISEVTTTIELYSGNAEETKEK